MLVPGLKRASAAGLRSDGAGSYTIQIDDTETFTSPLVNQNTTASQFTTSSLPTIRMWFRVRANSSSGTSGSWSSIRRFEVKQ
jgi:hypothetical protein